MSTSIKEKWIQLTCELPLKGQVGQEIYVHCIRASRYPLVTIPTIDAQICIIPSWSSTMVWTLEMQLSTRRGRALYDKPILMQTQHAESKKGQR